VIPITVDEERNVSKSFHRDQVNDDSYFGADHEKVKISKIKVKKN